MSLIKLFLVGHTSVSRELPFLVGSSSAFGGFFPDQEWKFPENPVKFQSQYSRPGRF
jgi:hypothetical protein